MFEKEIILEEAGWPTLRHDKPMVSEQHRSRPCKETQTLKEPKGRATRTCGNGAGL